eukprot:7742428-Lingulodinium_polyedra.AAC.1
MEIRKVVSICIRISISMHAWTCEYLRPQNRPALWGTRPRRHRNAWAPRRGHPAATRPTACSRARA